MGDAPIKLSLGVFAPIALGKSGPIASITPHTDTVTIFTTNFGN